MSDVKERLDRVLVPELEEILGEAFPVLDDGFVRLIDYMGCDDSIVQGGQGLLRQRHQGCWGQDVTGCCPNPWF